MTKPTTIRLARTYDADRLAGEVAALADLTRVRPGPFPTSGWDGIALVQGDGRIDDTRSPMPSRAGPRATPALARSPYLAEILGAFPAPVLVARLLYLEPGGSAGLHRDPIGFPVGVVRLHVPIVTHGDVELWIGGERARWAPGELWYGDFAFPHRLANPSPITRVHLVLDVCVTDALLALFRTELLRGALEGGVRRHHPVRPASDADLARFAKRLWLPPGSLPGVVAHEDLDLGVERGALVATSGGEFVLALDPIDERTFVVRGYYPGVTFELEGPDGAELVHRGRVKLPDGAVDDERTPWELFTSRSPLGSG